MRNMFTVRTAFIIVSLSIVSAFITGGIVLWFGMRYAENHQKLFFHIFYSRAGIDDGSFDYIFKI